MTKFPAFCGSRMFITVFTTARHLFLSWARLIQSTTPHSIVLTTASTLNSHLSLDLPNGLFLSTPHVPHAPPISSSWFYLTNNISKANHVLVHLHYAFSPPPYPTTPQPVPTLLRGSDGAGSHLISQTFWAFSIVCTEISNSTFRERLRPRLQACLFKNISLCTLVIYIGTWG